MLTSCIIIFLLTMSELFYFHIADHFNIIDKPNERSSHTNVVLRGGGIIFLNGTWLWAAFYGLQYPWFLAGLTLIAGVSFIDDVHSLSRAVRLVAHFGAMFLLFYEASNKGKIFEVDSPWLLALLVLVALIVTVGIINAYNFMDGINGITGGYTLAVLLPMLYLDTKGLAAIGLSNPFIELSLLQVTLMATMVFCFFNFRKKARCFAGDVGSVGAAFIVVFALGRLMIATGDITYIMLLAVYGVDSVLTICHRIMLHENLGQAHRKHAYQIMANEMKIPHTFVSTFYMVLQLAISLGLILTDCHWTYAAVIVLMLCGMYVYFMKEYYHLHEEYLAKMKGGR